VPRTDHDSWVELVEATPEVVSFGAYRGSRLLGALRVIPAGQFVHGRSVPMGGIAGVVVRPEARGGGVARTLLGEALGWMRATGIHVSSLHPASTRAYRSAGWELAGRAGWATISTRSLSAIRGDAAGPVVPLDATDRAARRACWERFGASVHGAVDRSSSFWWLHEHGDTQDGAFAYGVRTGSELSGYVAYTQTPDARSWGYTLRVDDIAAVDRATAVALWRFIGGHSMQVERTTLHLAALPALLLLLDEQDAVLDLENRWMHRIVDVPGAFATRGFPVGIETSVDVCVTDPVGPERTWTLAVADGRGTATATTGGPAVVRLDVGALSALSIGGASAGLLRTAGRVDGPDDDIARLASILAAPAPTITDDF
jgi:predicted acetyltransferase